MGLRLIVNADDLGMTAGVTKGIIESMSCGIVSSTTLMANMPSAAEAAALAIRQGLPVGLHLNLTTGRPISPPTQIPSLVRQDGSFYPYRELLARMLKLRVSVNEIFQEFSAQIETALNIGLSPTHVDTHHHIHLWWPVARALLRIGRTYGIQKTRTTRTLDTAVSKTIRLALVRTWAKSRYKAIIATLLARSFRMATWRMDASAFSAGEAAGRCRSRLDEWFALVRALEKLPADIVVEVPCHPGYIDEELRRYANYVAGREEEVLALTSQELRNAMSTAGIQLISFREL